MNIKVTGEHVSITDAMHNYVNEKFTQLHHPDKLMDAQFKVGKEGPLEWIRFSGKIGKTDILIKSEHVDFYSAVNTLMDKLKVNFAKAKRTKHKDKPRIM